MVIAERKGKELESKVVFISNVIKDTHGLFLRNQRLFHVPMTRAKEDLTPYTQEQSKRDFIEEIEKNTQ